MISGAARAESSEDQRALEALAATWAIPIPAFTRDALLVYCRLLLSWGTHINLTAARSTHELVTDHLPDAFALAARFGDEAARVIDVGSGGGLPVVPLAILRPAATCALYEPTAKKVAFLRTAIRDLQLGTRMSIEPVRVDPKDHQPAELFDIAISRATFAPSDWLSLAWRLVVPGGRVFALSSRRLDHWPDQLAMIDQQDYRSDRWVSELRRST